MLGQIYYDYHIDRKINIEKHFLIISTILGFITLKFVVRWCCFLCLELIKIHKSHIYTTCVCKYSMSTQRVGESIFTNFVAVVRSVNIQELHGRWHGLKLWRIKTSILTSIGTGIGRWGFLSEISHGRINAPQYIYEQSSSKYHIHTVWYSYVSYQIDSSGYYRHSRDTSDCIRKTINITWKWRRHVLCVCFSFDFFFFFNTIHFIKLIFRRLLRNDKLIL